jgi:hypothetical protein
VLCAKMKLKRHQCISFLHAQLVWHSGLPWLPVGRARESIPNADSTTCNLSATILHGDIHDSDQVHLERV